MDSYARVSVAWPLPSCSIRGATMIPDFCGNPIHDIFCCIVYLILLIPGTKIVWGYIRQRFNKDKPGKDKHCCHEHVAACEKKS